MFRFARCGVMVLLSTLSAVAKENVCDSPCDPSDVDALSLLQTQLVKKTTQLEASASPAWDISNCPMYTGTGNCWATTAFQYCPYDEQGAYDAVMKVGACDATTPIQCQGQYKIFEELVDGKINCTEGPAPAPTPAPTSAPPSPGPPSPGSSEKATSANCGSEGFTQAEAQEMLDWHNKFRCAVGNPPIEWNGALQCQAQETQNKIGAFSHSNSYSLDISSGENLATGTSVSMAAWMWFTEYTQADCSAGHDKCGHYTAMVWKSSTQLGCGIQRDGGGGVIRCQYAASPPNYADQYSSNVPKFEGEESKFQKCGLTIEETKQKVEQFKGWGILHPIAPYDSSLGI